jgi:hypothetical protein
MSLLTRIIMEAERASAREFIREEGLRAAMQAAARQANTRRASIRQEPAPAGQRADPRVTGRTRVGGVGAPITNNSAGQPTVSVVGRSPRPTKPIRSMKSRIVPEPGQIQSKPPTRAEIPEH